MLNRKPKGYIGLNHTTHGNDILAVLASMHMPERTLGPDLARRLKEVKPREFYPIGLMLELLDTLDAKLGSYHLRQVGWTIFARHHAEQTKAHFSNAHDLLHALDGMYHHNNRGMSIGGWVVLSFEAGRAVLEKTTPHHCGMEQGILEEALRTIGVRAKVHQAKCFREGADCCHFVVEVNAADGRWFKAA